MTSPLPVGHRPAPPPRARRAIALPALAATAVALASAALLLALAGCASSAGIAPQSHTIAPASLGLAAGGTPTPALASDWWRAFGDPALDALIDRALAGNPGLRAAQARVARAQAAVGGAQAAEGVHLNAEADLTRERISANGIYPPPLGGANLTVVNTQLGASWEADFFGRNRAAVEAAVGTERAAQAELQAARALLASRVAATYVQLGRLFALRDVAERSLAQRDQLLALIRQRVGGGLDTTVELRQGQGALPEARQQIEQLDEQIALARHALAALTAQAPDPLDTLHVPLTAVQAVPLPAHVPAELLGR
ncbi:MAG: TolC family protein, partial [Burkholderiales bacterium]|nr:TolC family protein [Burkholderiales bacterium]